MQHFRIFNVFLPLRIGRAEIRVTCCVVHIGISTPTMPPNHPKTHISQEVQKTPSPPHLFSFVLLLCHLRRLPLQLRYRALGILQVISIRFHLRDARQKAKDQHPPHPRKTLTKPGLGDSKAPGLLLTILSLSLASSAVQCPFPSFCFCS